MNLNNITALEDFEQTPTQEATVVLYIEDETSKATTTHFIYLTPEQIAKIVQIDKDAKQVKAASEVPGQGKAGLQGQGSHITGDRRHVWSDLDY